MLKEFTVYITETTTRQVMVMAETPADAQRIAEENYSAADVIEVDFEADPAYRY